MKLTARFKAWLIEHAGVQKDASDADFEAAAMKAITDKTLTLVQVVDLQAETKTVETSAINAEVEARLAEMVKRVDTIEDVTAKKTEVDAFSKMLNDAIEKGLKPKEEPKEGEAGAATKMLQQVPNDNVRVVGAHERYSTSKTAAMVTKVGHPMFGKQATMLGRTYDMPSELDKAVSGAYFKFCVQSSAAGRPVPRGLRMTEHDRDLLQFAMHKLPWTGIIGGNGTEVANAVKVDNRLLKDMEIKSLLDDATSGGVEAAPIAFDDAVILTPILFGELFPLVDVVPLSRGRRVEGWSITNPTFANVAEGTAITPFTTTSMIAAFDTTVYPAVGAIEIGLDFEDDSPSNVGAIVIGKYGEAAQAWLDEQIAIGDGTTEPQGITVAAGTVGVTSTNGGAGPPTVTDYESLLFGVTKKFRPTADSARTVYVANETSYRRARGIAVSGTDERRVFGMDHRAYMMLDAPYKINDAIANTKIAFCNLRHYRMYRRLGMQVRTETAGNYLALRNMMVVVVRMRWGGQLTLGGACSIITNGQS